MDKSRLNFANNRVFNTQMCHITTGSSKIKNQQTNKMQTIYNQIDYNIMDRS